MNLISSLNKCHGDQLCSLKEREPLEWIRWYYYYFKSKDVTIKNKNKIQTKFDDKFVVFGKLRLSVVKKYFRFGGGPRFFSGKDQIKQFLNIRSIYFIIYAIGSFNNFIPPHPKTVVSIHVHKYL